VNALHSLVIAGLVAITTAPGFARAQTAAGHDHHAAPAMVKTAMEMSEGEVRKVDVAGKKITLKHGPLKNLDMPPMTMAFEVSDPALLAKVKAGDKVRFVAANPGGKLTVTEIQVVK
jgi:Cu(I)/Ag(I) efflux system protein CusF